MGYRDRHVVVTGGTGALGTAVVGALLGAGAFCHVPHLPIDTMDRFPHRGHARLRLVADGQLTDAAAVDHLFAGVPALWASIHIAGSFAMGGIAEAGKSALSQMLEANAVTCYLCCAAAVLAMRRTGAGGRIVNVASRQALEPRLGTGMVAYTASKAAVAALTEALAEEVAKDGILVNAVAPSIMDTVANRAAMPKADYTLWPKVGEVAATILFLASPDNQVTRGAVVPVYGKS
jgi:NAD(P)-dependent dehydrogenase (short-subunit alcohol dehydrogenase family)